MKIEALKLKRLNKIKILQILRIKDSFWKKGLESQKNWFSKNIMPNDLHVLLYNNKKHLIGYNLLRVRKFFLNNKINKKNFCLYFDTLIIKKSFRNQKLSLKILFKTHEISKKKKIAHDFNM